MPDFCGVLPRAWAATYRDNGTQQGGCPSGFSVYPGDDFWSPTGKEKFERRRRSSGWSSSRGPSRKERERETRNGPWESWYQEDWYDDWPDQDRWSWRNPHPRDDADEDWGPEEEEEYEDTEEEDAEERDLSADSRESYENATSESSPDLQASQEEPHPSTTGKQAMKSS